MMPSGVMVTHLLMLIHLASGVFTPEAFLHEVEQLYKADGDRLDSHGRKLSATPRNECIVSILCTDSAEILRCTVWSSSAFMRR